jgi:1-deoxy-D-xylulose-5-phosphate synthase
MRTGEPGGGVILAYGAMVHPAAEAAAALEAEGLLPTVVDARFAKPLDEDLFLRLIGPGEAVITVEEAVTAGGFGSAVRELLDARGRRDVRILEIGLPIEVYPVGKVDQIRRDFGLDAPGLTSRFRSFLKG